MDSPFPLNSAARRLRPTRETVERGIQHLRQADPVLGRVIDQVGPFRVRLEQDRFRALVRSIIFQQISGRAAESIFQRLHATVRHDLSPTALAALSQTQLRAAGISPQKAGYLLDLARRVRDEQVQLGTLGRLRDDAVIRELVKVKGIGVWTAQMFLIFSLGRLNVFPYGDLGVRAALRDLYGLHDLPDRAQAEQIACAWQPFATMGSWYCWRSLENKTPSNAKATRE